MYMCVYTYVYIYIYIYIYTCMSILRREAFDVPVPSRALRDTMLCYSILYTILHTILYYTIPYSYSHGSRALSSDRVSHRADCGLDSWYRLVQRIDHVEQTIHLNVCSFGDTHHLELVICTTTTSTHTTYIYNTYIRLYELYNTHTIERIQQHTII